MRKLNVTILLLFNFGIYHQLVSGQSAKGSKLLLFLMDGFRWDYFDQPGVPLPGFSRIIKTGVKAEYMISDFPTLSYPNYYSIMTGLHIENHGMTGNFMYDVKHNTTFLIGTNKAQYEPYWWDDGEPLWVTAEKQGKRAYMYYWPGCEVTILGVNSTYCKQYPLLVYPKLPQLQSSIAESLELFSNNSADLVGIYVELPDKYGHMYGPKSKKLNEVLQEIDQEMTKLLDELETRNLRDDVNIMIFSDHGMTDVNESRVVNITDVVDMSDIKIMLDSGPNCYIWPEEGKLYKVYNDLKGMGSDHMMVFKKEDIPDRWFYKKHYRTSPILLVAELGWYIATPVFPRYYSYLMSGPLRGSHGYDNNEKDMRAIFLGTGPDFRENVEVPAFTNVNLYQVMCHLLDLKPHKNNGTWSNIQGMMVVSSASTYTLTTGLLLLLSLLSYFI